MHLNSKPAKGGNFDFITDTYNGYKLANPIFILTNNHEMNGSLVNPTPKFSVVIEPKIVHISFVEDNSDSDIALESPIRCMKE